jgi:hypothetical protein
MNSISNIINRIKKFFKLDTYNKTDNKSNNNISYGPCCAGDKIITNKFGGGGRL